ncbi:MAG TPA: hypothetical protein VES62_18430 [Thermoleophilaceae bacterium]|nr:hypothetical protein [Thermoleophilaceae bacterium]
MVRLVAACLGLAALSLLLPSELSYDPVAWVLWGREIAHFQLDTSGGPSWKPLPVVFTTLVAPLGELDRGLPSALWMAVARAGTLLAMAMAVRLVLRLGGGGAAGAFGGAVAVVALCLTPDWFQFAAHGSEAPLAVAFMLWAFERHLDGRAGHALALGTLACLLRPELVPFLGLYGLWAWLARPHLRPALAAVAVLLPAAWVVPEWIGSGNPLDGGEQARSEPVWSLSLAERPWLRALERIHNHSGPVLEILTAVAAVAALARRRWAVLALAGAALAEASLYVLMTQAGFSGNPRYVLPALALACVLAGIGAADVVNAGMGLARRVVRAARSGSAQGTRLAGAAGALAGAAAVALLGASFVDARTTRLEHEVRQVGIRMKIHRDLGRAVARLGGPSAVAALGPATANRALHSRIAWELGVPMGAVESIADYRVVFRSDREHLVGRVYLRGRAHSRQTLDRVGSFWIYRRDGITLPNGERKLEAIGSPFTSTLQGVHIPPRGAGSRRSG